MYQIAQPIWNRIARSHSLRTQWATVMFSLDQDEAQRVMEAVGEKLKAQGSPPKVILAYLTVLPLLLEHRALQEYVRLNPDRATAFPEVLSRTEAVQLMSRDMMLSPSESTQLMTLLPERISQIPTLWADPMTESLPESSDSEAPPVRHVNYFLEEVKALLRQHPEWTKRQGEDEAVRLRNLKAAEMAKKPAASSVHRA